MKRALEIFEARCDARAILWSASIMDLHAAVDGLQFAAVHSGLVADLGQDTIQQIMSDAFGARRDIQC